MDPSFGLDCEPRRPWDRPASCTQTNKTSGTSEGLRARVNKGRGKSYPFQPRAPLLSWKFKGVNCSVPRGLVSSVHSLTGCNSTPTVNLFVPKVYQEVGKT